MNEQEAQVPFNRLFTGKACKVVNRQLHVTGTTTAGKMRSAKVQSLKLNARVKNGKS